MEFIKLSWFMVLIAFLPTFKAENLGLFRLYIGAESKSIKLSDVPINSHVEFHFILAFAIDYTKGDSPVPTNGIFDKFWESQYLNPGEIGLVKHIHRNVKIGLSLGGDTVKDNVDVYFAPKSIDSWVKNAVRSLTKLITEYDIDGIDIDYEHFSADPETFAECIGRLIITLKRNKVISFASIAPYEGVQSHYLALWKKYGHAIDYVNFQFYAYEKGINIPQFVKFFDEQVSNYAGGQILASFDTAGDGGLRPNNGFFEACSELGRKRELGGIFVWCADESQKFGFQNEKVSQEFLSSMHLFHA